MAQRSPVHQSSMDVQEPDTPSDHQMPVNPSVDDPPAEGLSTMAGLFPKAVVVDEVQELPMQQQAAAEPPQFWVIRPKEDIEDMTLGVPIVHLAFKAGVRYKVPRNIAYELARLDYLIEVPFPYDEHYATAGRR